MDTPTPDQIRERSAFLTARYPSGAEGDAGLALLLMVTAPLVGSLTGRNIADEEGEEVPPAKVPIAIQVIAMKTEQFDSAIGTVKGRKRSLTRGNLASFSAGSYSESYFGPAQIMAAKQLDSDPVLSELLWALCTDQRKQEWLEFWDPEDYPSGVGQFVSFEWGNRPNYSSGGWPAGARYWG